MALLLSSLTRMFQRRTVAPGTVPTPPFNDSQRSDRPILWEDDFSRNTLDESPFQNEPAIHHYPIREIREIFERDAPPWLRDSRSVESFVEKDSCPLPRAEDREDYFANCHPAYWLSGLIDYLKIEFTLKKYQFQPQSVFELGCASGRLLRHLSFQGGYPTIWASDINYRHVRWIMSYLPNQIRALHNHVFPTLPIGDGKLDFICAFSVFTHIDTFETAWIAELHRILRSGGMAYISVHTEHTWQALGKLPATEVRVKSILENERNRSGIFEKLPAERRVFRFSKTGPYRSCVYESSEFIQNLWGRFFTILEILPIHHGMDQTVLVLRKE